MGGCENAAPFLLREDNTRERILVRLAGDPRDRQGD